MQITLEVKKNALQKVLALLEELKDDVKIIKKEEPYIEIIAENDPDYQLVTEARKRRQEGEKRYNIDDVLKSLQ